MKPEQFWRVGFMLTWTLLTLLLLMCPGNSAQELQLDHKVFVTFTGEDLTIRVTLRKPANQTKDILACFSPFHQKIYSCDIPATAGSPENHKLHLELKNLSVSGEYYCQYKKSKVQWFLRVRSEGFEEPEMLDYTEFIIVAVFTGVLLVFSVVGSVYVFRGHWCGHTNTAQKQNQEEKEANRREEDAVDAVTDQSSSFYASLEPRPRSVYGVLDRSAANKQTDQKKAKPKKKDHQKTGQQTKRQPDEGVFESVYENF